MDGMIEEFISITGSDVDTARRFLELADSNLENAVALYVDDSNDHSEPTTSFSMVRAPIVQHSALLVNETFQSTYTASKRPKSSNSVFDKFRDFQAEIAEQAQVIKEAAKNSVISNNESKSSVDKSTEMPDGALAKRRTLESLFRPPLELMFRGNFEAVKQESIKKKRWLLVNVQNVEEFACQALNRDIWSHHMVKDIISDSFIFWQIHFDSADGNRFRTYYPIDNYPFVAAIDPLTGEMVKIFRILTDAVVFCDSVVSFLESHSNPMICAAPQQHKSSSENTEKMFSLKRKMANPLEEDSPGPSTKCSKTDAPPAPKSNASAVVHNGFPLHSNDLDLTEAKTSDQCWQDFTAASGDQIRLMFRLPNGTKHLLKVNSHSKLKAIFLYGQTVLSLPTLTHNYVLNYPRRVLNDLDTALDLDSLGFHKQEIIFIEIR